jgi:hypothetical protein
MNLRVPQKAGNFLTSYATISFSSRPLLHEVVVEVEVVVVAIAGVVVMVEEEDAVLKTLIRIYCYKMGPNNWVF